MQTEKKLLQQNAPVLKSGAS